MEFGRVAEDELDEIVFKLPPEPLFNKQVLDGKPAPNPKVYVGCAKWGRTEWLGKIYPSKTKEKNFFLLRKIEFELMLFIYKYLQCKTFFYL